MLFKSSFRNKCLPSEWKYANITPLYKKGSRSDPGNYRPVSLTSIVCKLMEFIICDNVTTHFKLNHLFSSKQFGFIKSRSTSLQLSQYCWDQYCLSFILMILLNMLIMDRISIYMRMMQNYFLLLKPWKIQLRFKKI